MYLQVKAISNTFSKTAQEFKWKIKYFHPYQIFRGLATVTDESALLTKTRCDGLTLVIIYARENIHAEMHLCLRMCECV